MDSTMSTMIFAALEPLLAQAAASVAAIAALLLIYVKLSNLFKE